MIEHPILIHIGYQKTGTTWLQKLFFKSSTNNFSLFSDRKLLNSLLVTPHPLDFNAEKSINLFNTFIETASTTNQYPVISYERLSSTPFFGGYDSTIIANRFQVIFKNPKILIVIREQVDMVLSTYGQYVKMGGGLTLSKFLKSNGNIKARSFELQRFRYHRLITYYQNLFGKDNVLVLPYEQFKHSPEVFLQNLFTFCNLNLPSSDLSLSIKKKSNPSNSTFINFLNAKSNQIICHSSLLNPVPIIPISKIYHKRYIQAFFRGVNRLIPNYMKKSSVKKSRRKIEHHLQEFYKESNQKTENLTGLKLGQYGYQL